MDAKDNVFINNRFFRTLLKLKGCFGGPPTRRGGYAQVAPVMTELNKVLAPQIKGKGE